MRVSLRCLVTADPEGQTAMLAEIVGVDLFAESATAVSDRQLPTGEVELIAGFDSEDDARKALTSVSTRYGPQVRGLTITSHEPDWTRSQRAGLQPTRIGPWSIRAPWDSKPADTDSLHDIVIDPGTAFGHGAHPTTVMAIELVLRNGAPGRHLVDIGTGTGVIAIIAARLGMTVDAIESDRSAVEVARRNIEQNTSGDHPQASTRINVHEGNAADVSSVGTEGLVVANVTLDVQRQVAPAVSAASTVLLSGLLCRQVNEASRLYPDHDAVTIRTHGEWASLELRRRRRLVGAQNG